MRTIVNQKNKEEVFNYLCTLNNASISLDTETYGLAWEDKMFALQLHACGNSFYFNFHDYKDGTFAHTYEEIKTRLNPLFRNSNILWVMANAKFDMRRLAIADITLNGHVYDVLLMARLEYNQHMSYSLDSCLKRIGKQKNDKVSLWIKDNKAYTHVVVPGKKTKEKRLHYDRVPFEIMTEYGLDDVEGTHALFEYQMDYFRKPENSEQLKLVEANTLLSKVVFNMEERGILLDVPYCKEMSEKISADISALISELESITGTTYSGGPKWLSSALASQGIKLAVSEKGNYELDYESLSSIDNAVAALVLTLREKEKEKTFFDTFLRYHVNGVIHTSYRLNGTDTGRFSCSEPNLQQVPSGDVVRRAFIPRKDYLFASIDYSAMEFRLCVDYADETSMIKAIDDGLDPHQKVADDMGSDRKSAKTLNFLTLYGGGAAKLASQLHCDIPKARQLQQAYYAALPKVRKLHTDVQAVSKSRGYIKNSYGMRFFLRDPEFSYKMVNHLIQGTGACILRSAMIKLDYFLDGLKSKLLLQIHDELIFEIHKDEIHVLKELVRIMEDEWEPLSGMRMKCDCDISYNSWSESTFKKYTWS